MTHDPVEGEGRAGRRGPQVPAAHQQQLPDDTRQSNERVAARFLETARILENQGANPFRVRAYRRAARTLQQLRRPVEQILREEGAGGLDRLAGIGPGLAAAICSYVATGRMPLQERLLSTRAIGGELVTIPGIGPALAGRLRDELGVVTLEDLEVAAYDGRLEKVSGIGPRRLDAIRLMLAARLSPSRSAAPSVSLRRNAPIAELLDVDREYRELASSGRLPTVAPRRMNPRHRAWLPILHTRRGPYNYTALFSNTPRAHQLGRTHDWVVVYFGDDGDRGQNTVVTELTGALRGERIVRGREAECADYYVRDRGINSRGTPSPTLESV